MKHDPDVVCWELVLLKLLGFLWIDEWGEDLVVALCGHTVCDDDVLEATFLSYVVILRDISWQSRPRFEPAFQRLIHALRCLTKESRRAGKTYVGQVDAWKYNTGAICDYCSL